MRNYSCLTLALWAGLPLIALPQTVTWTGAVSTDWNNPTSWTPQQAPALTNHLVIAAGIVAVPPDEAFAVLDWPGGPSVGAVSAPTSLNLVVTTYATNTALPSLFITRAPGGLLVTWPLGFPDWTLQSSTNLPSQFWAPVSTTCGNQALVPITAPQQYFRLYKPYHP